MLRLWTATFADVVHIGLLKTHQLCQHNSNQKPGLSYLLIPYCAFNSKLNLACWHVLVPPGPLKQQLFGCNCGQWFHIANMFSYK